MKQQVYIPFTKEMKKDYTILIPTMLPMHFKMIISVLKTYGYKAELLETQGTAGLLRRGLNTYITTHAIPQYS